MLTTRPVVPILFASRSTFQDRNSSHLNQRHVCAYLAELRSIILAAYTASQHAAGAKWFIPSTYLYSVHGRTNSQFLDLVTFVLFFFSISLRSTWCSAKHSLGISVLEHYTFNCHLLHIWLVGRLFSTSVGFLKQYNGIRTARRRTFVIANTIKCTYFYYYFLNNE